MNPTPELLMVFRSRGKLISGPGQERDLGIHSYASWSQTKAPDSRSPEAKLLQVKTETESKDNIRREVAEKTVKGQAGGRQKPILLRWPGNMWKESMSLTTMSHWLNQLQNCPTFGLLVM